MCSVVVMKGAGDRAFVSGADISEFEAQRSNPETIKKYDAIGAAAGRAYGELDKPMIAMIQGYCMGGGLLTSLRADLRIASDDSQFGVPAARLGLGYGYGGVKSLMDLVGRPATEEILITGKRFDANDAMRWGPGQPRHHPRRPRTNRPRARRHNRPKRPPHHPRNPLRHHRNHQRPQQPQSLRARHPNRRLLQQHRLQRRPHRLHAKTPPGSFAGR